MCTQWTSKFNPLQIAAFLSTGAVGVVGLFNFDSATNAKVTASFAVVGEVITFLLRT